MKKNIRPGIPSRRVAVGRMMGEVVHRRWLSRRCGVGCLVPDVFRNKQEQLTPDFVTSHICDMVNCFILKCFDQQRLPSQKYVSYVITVDLNV